MNWLKKVSEDKITFFKNVKENNSTNFRVTTFNNPDNIESKFTSLTQYFLISYKKQLDASGSGVVTHIKIPNDDMFAQIIQEVALHFKSIELIQEDENITEIMLNEPFESSLEQINKLKINPIINDIFMREGNYEHLQPYQVKKKMFYEVDFSYIDSYENVEFDSVYDSICAVSSGKEDVLIYPKNWIVNDDLKDSLAIRYFSNHQKTKSLYLKVDAETNLVLYMHIKF
jgi:hypothetical protein